MVVVEVVVTAHDPQPQWPGSNLAYFFRGQELDEPSLS